MLESLCRLVMLNAVLAVFLSGGCAADTGHRKGATSEAKDTSGEARRTIIVAGHRHFCAYRDGSGLRCWGDNQRGQLGDGSRAQREQPRLVLGLPPGYVLRHLAAWGDSSCATLNDGSAWCWGAGRDVAERVEGLPAVRSVVVDDKLMCALTTRGSVLCRWRQTEPDQDLGLAFEHDWKPTAAESVQGLMAVASLGAICGDVVGAKAPCWRKNRDQYTGSIKEVHFPQERSTLRVAGSGRSQRCFSGHCVLDSPEPGATAVANGCALSGFEVFCGRGAGHRGPVSSTGLKGIAAIASWPEGRTCAVPRDSRRPVVCDTDADGEFETASRWTDFETAQQGAWEVYRSRTQSLLHALEWRWRGNNDARDHDGGLGFLYVLDGDFEKAWRALGPDRFLSFTTLMPSSHWRWISWGGNHCEMGLKGAQRLVAEGTATDALRAPLLMWMSSCLDTVKRHPPKKMKTLVEAIDTKGFGYTLWGQLARLRFGLNMGNAGAAAAQMLAHARTGLRERDRARALVDVAEVRRDIGDTAGAVALVREVWGSKFKAKWLNASGGGAEESRVIGIRLARRMARIAATAPVLAARIQAVAESGATYDSVVGQVEDALKAFKDGRRKEAEQRIDQAGQHFLKLDGLLSSQTMIRSEARGLLLKANLALKRWDEALAYVSLKSLGDVVIAANGDPAGRKWLQSVDQRLLQPIPSRSLRDDKATCEEELMVRRRETNPDLVAYAKRCRAYLSTLRSPAGEPHVSEPLLAAGLLAKTGDYLTALTLATGAHADMRTLILKEVTAKWLRARKPKIDGLQKALEPFIPKPPGRGSAAPE